MTSILENIFSKEDLEYLQQLPEVLQAKERLEQSSTSSYGVVYFNIPLTPSIQHSLAQCFDLDLSKISELPMRWIRGDTAPHIDVGSSKFEKTYLAYVNDNLGEFLIGEDSYSMSENTGLVFSEGNLHQTRNTGNVPRLLVGPMNEFAQPVGGPITNYVLNGDFSDTYEDPNINGYPAFGNPQATHWSLVTVEGDIGQNYVEVDQVFGT